MRTLLTLIFPILLLNFAYAQDCNSIKVIILKIDSITSQNITFATFILTDTLTKQIWWDKLKNPNRDFKLGTMYNLQLRKRYPGKIIEQNGEIINERGLMSLGVFYIDGKRYEEYEICDK